VRNDAEKVKGLLLSTFMIEDLRTCYTLSFWTDEDAVIEFNTHTISHIGAANSCFAHLEMGERGVELWSAQMRVCGTSPHNLRWRSRGSVVGSPDFDKLFGCSGGGG
jgi:hypothetical protein